MPKMTDTSARGVPVWLLVFAQAVVSAASLVVEIVAGRMLAPHVGMSLYTWTSIIAVVLAGFSVGHWWGGRLAERPAHVALNWTGAALLAGAATTVSAVPLLPLIAGPVLANLTQPVWSIAILTCLVFFLPSMFAGIPAPVLTKIAISTDERTGPVLGAMFAAGAIGAILGTLLAGFVFISWFGSAKTLVIVAATYLICGAVFLWFGRWRGIGIAISASVLIVALGAYAMSAANPCDRESQYFCLRVEDISANLDDPVHLMVIDHLAHGVSAKRFPLVQFTDHSAMLDRLSVLRATRENFSSFHIGGGNYAVPRAFATRGSGEIVVAEIDPEVTDLAQDAFWFDPDTAIILHEDGRRALQRRPDTRYDIILGDAFTDIVVPVHLVTQEFFQIAAEHLTDGGSFLMNVIDHEDQLFALGSIVATMRSVFPVVEVWTEQVTPASGQRMVFVVVGGNLRTPIDSFVAPAPEPTRFGALAEGVVAYLADQRGTVLTDDYAPIDRLMSHARN